MCTQFLPIRALGKMLFNNQIVEEHVHEDGESGKAFKEIKFHPVHGHVNYLAIEIFIQELFSHYHEQLPPNHSMEVSTPPPNC
ncbi:hypothetical protein DCM91_09255 [Chitinophaga costaii]|nr:hypothetical protein DCM91_09255 [Chitinophaga costaii]